MKTPRSLKLSLRELLLLVAVAAVGMGWWRDHRRLGAFEGVVEMMETTGPESEEHPAFEARVILYGHMWEILGERLD